MRLRYSEFCHNYETYSFGYAVYAQPESIEELPHIYSLGFLPYSDRPELGTDLFYMARGVRVNLELFRVRSEERYVVNKMRDLDLVMSVLPKSEVVGNVSCLESVCLSFAASKFENCKFGAERLRYILERSYLTHIAVFRKASEPTNYLAFAFLVCVGDMMHVWFSFHQVLAELEKNFGKYVIVRLLEHARDRGLRHCYLGTCYGRSSRYKTSFPGAEFFDGINWTSNHHLLHQYHQNDDLQIHQVADSFKLSPSELVS